MAILIQCERAVPAWLEAVRHLAEKKKYTDRNLVLEIASPCAISHDDRVIIAAVDEALKTNTELSIDTVAGTIFPNGMYRQHGRPEFYTKFTEVMKRAKKKGTWGTYALRMISRVARDGKTTFNPLETIISKLESAREGRCYQAAYELGITDAEFDLDNNIEGFGCELPLYEPATDRKKAINMPCLSHLSFKVTENKLDLTAMYRSHWYVQRALGKAVSSSNRNTIEASLDR